MMYEGQFIKLPETLKSGTYYIYMEVDPNNYYLESNEHNNTSLIKIKLQLFTNPLAILELDSKFFFKALKLNIPILGICHGAQYIAKKFKSIIKEKKHVGSHNINLIGFGKKVIVNSFHNKVITKLGKNLLPKGFAQDNTIEYFEHKQKKIIGIMWHPERYKKFKKIDQNIVKKLCK